MSKLMLLGAALVMLLVSLPLISIGTMQDNPTLWLAGLALLAVSGLVPPITRYAFADGDDNGDDGADDADKGDTGAGDTDKGEADKDDDSRENRK